MFRLRGGCARSMAQPGGSARQSQAQKLPGAFNHISYELCVLQGLHKSYVAKKSVGEGRADRYRNPDATYPPISASNGRNIMTDLNQPLDGDAFIAGEKQALPTR